VEDYSTRKINHSYFIFHYKTTFFFLTSWVLNTFFFLLISLPIDKSILGLYVLTLISGFLGEYHLPQVASNNFATSTVNGTHLAIVPELLQPYQLQEAQYESLGDV